MMFAQWARFSRQLPGIIRAVNQRVGRFNQEAGILSPPAREHFKTASRVSQLISLRFYGRN
jgi:hypothetical protein